MVRHSPEEVQFVDAAEDKWGWQEVLHRTKEKAAGSIHPEPTPQRHTQAAREPLVTLTS